MKTFFIESGHQGTELISSTQELSFVIEKTHASSLGAAVELLFSLRPICHFCSWHLFNYISFITMFHICFLCQTACFSLRPICHLPFGQSATCPSPHRSCSAFLHQLDFFHVHISYLFPLSDCMFRPLPDLPLFFAQFTSSLRPILLK